MSGKVLETTRIRRKVLTEVAKLALNNRLKEEINSLPKKLVNEGFESSRCCEFKEQAILSRRIMLALGINLKDAGEEDRLDEIAAKVLEKDFCSDKSENNHNNQPYFAINLIEEACDRCPIDRIVVTNACRNCVAHHCVNTCPRNAIEIVGNRAYINKERCVECGLCVQACPYGAILDVERPCSRACKVNALVPGENGIASIDYEKCVQCGACISACPFGALDYRSDIIKVIRMLKSSHNVIALVAPAFIGQFGPMVEWNAVEAGLNLLGFAGVVPVALGADLTIEEEGREVIEKLTRGEQFMFNSCCPSFKNLIKAHFKDQQDKISDTPSPMLMVARWLKEKYAEEDLKLVFIGPCVAKKGEAVNEGRELIDAVLTFEEMACLLVASDINLARIEKEPGTGNSFSYRRPSIAAKRFCKAGGVGEAIKNGVVELAAEESKLKEEVAERIKNLRVLSFDGLEDCIKTLKLVSAGKIDADFIEGMACKGGCIGGPGNLVNPKVSGRLLDKKSSEEAKKEAVNE